MTATTRTAAETPAAMTPNEFMAQLRLLLKAGRAAEVVALFARHGPEVLDRLSEPQRLRLDAIMDWADTVTEFQPPAGHILVPPRAPAQPRDAPTPQGEDVPVPPGPAR